MDEALRVDGDDRSYELKSMDVPSSAHIHSYYMILTIRLGLSMSFVKPSQTDLTQNFSNVANMIEGRGWVESKSM